MTKKKRELIEILLDNVKPEDWPESLPYAAQDKCDSAVYVYSGIPDITSIYNGCWHPGSLDCELIKTVDVICKFWNKTIVHRDEFMKRWDERNAPGEAKTPQQLALDKFGTDWHENDGETPLFPGVVTIDIEFKNGIIRTGRDSDDSSFDIPFVGGEGFTVKKWRVHSKTSTTKQEVRTEETKPIRQDEKFKAGGYSGTGSVNAQLKQSATDTQVGGNHYTKLAIQPMQYSMKNGLDALQHTVIKYVTRFRDKAGIEDLEKAKHCIDMLIEFERGKNDNYSI